jgi:hypothetical protein
MVLDLNPTGGTPMTYLTVAGDRLFFVRLPAADGFAGSSRSPI